MKLEVNVGDLDSSILDWYDNADPIDITNALYHGYNIVSNPQFSKHLEGKTDSAMDLLQEENAMLKNEIVKLQRKNEEYYITSDGCRYGVKIWRIKAIR